MVSGRAALSVASARQFAAQDDRVVLLRRTATTDDIAALAVCAGLVTAVRRPDVARRGGGAPAGIATVVGCRELSIDVDELVRFGGHEIAEGALVTVDGDRGLVFEGELTTTVERPTALIERVRVWRASATNGYATTLTAPAS